MRWTSSSAARSRTAAFGRGLYVTIVRALGADPRFHKAEVMAQAADLLAAEEAERHRRVLVVVDEAHLLTPAQLEELRLLTNQELDSASPFAGILVGQPTLARQLRMGVFAALDQRIATRFTIKPMDLAESTTYLRHHLALVGRDEPLFADDAIARLHRVSNGLPRALNNAATAALIRTGWLRSRRIQAPARTAPEERSTMTFRAVGAGVLPREAVGQGGTVGWWFLGRG
jgi:type II secretory pathway predicted ATPase ExeA